VAELINNGTNKIKARYGWRVSLVLVAVPASIITTGTLFLRDTPNSLLERGHADEARRLLHHICGMKDINEEYADLVAASEEARQVEHPWWNILALVPLEIRSLGPDAGVVGDLPTGDPTEGIEHQRLHQHAHVPLHCGGDNNCMREEEENFDIRTHIASPQVRDRPLAPVPLHRSTPSSSCCLCLDLNREYLGEDLGGLPWTGGGGVGEWWVASA
jgi:hypothetical protein